MSKSNSIDMVSGSILGPLIKYSIPIMLTGILQLLFNTADLIVVGQFADETAIAAVGACGSIINLMINFFVGISLGSTVVLASTIGAKEEHKISNITHTTFALGIIFGVITTIMGVFLAKPLLTVMDTPTDVLPQASLYLTIYFCGNLPFLIYTFGRSIIVAIGDTRRPLIYLTLSGILNVILNLILVAGVNFGVAGVAIATVSSQAMSAILMTRALLKLDHLCRIDIKKLAIHQKTVGSILKLGVPVGLQSTLFSISNVLIQSSINSLGTLCVAGNSAASSLDAFIYTSMNSFTQGVTTFTGQNYGARQYKRIVKIFKYGILCTLVIGFFMGSFMYLNGTFLLGFYLPSSPEAIEFGLIRLMIMGLFNFFAGLMDCGTGVIRGMNKSLYPMITNIIGTCAFRIIWILTAFKFAFSHWKITSAYKILISSYPISWLLTFMAMIVYFVIIYRKAVKSSREI